MDAITFSIEGYDKSGRIECILRGFTTTERQIARARMLLNDDPIIKRVIVRQEHPCNDGSWRYSIILDETDWH